MRRLIALAVAVTLTAVVLAPPAEAGHHAVAVGVAATVGFVLAAPFLLLGAVFAPLLPPPVAVAPYPPAAVVARPMVAPRPVYAAPVAVAPVARPAPMAPVGSVTVAPARAASALPASIQTTVVHPSGRYELRGDGVRVAYHWVWIPNGPTAPGPVVAASAP
jgi:hypothetical protein